MISGRFSSWIAKEPTKDDLSMINAPIKSFKFCFKALITQVGANHCK